MKRYKALALNDTPDRPAPLLRRLLKPFLIAGVVSLLALGGSYFIKNTYQADTSLFFPQDSAGNAASGLGALLKRGSGGGGGGSVSLDDGAVTSPLVGSAPTMAASLLASRDTQDQLIKRMDLTSVWGLRTAKAREHLHDNFVTDIDKSGLLTITMYDHDPDLATNILRAALKILAERSNDLSFNVAKENRVLTEKRFAEADKRVRILEAKYGKLLTSDSLGDAGESVKAYFAARETYEKAHVKNAADQASYAAMASSLNDLYAGPGSVADKITVAAGTSQALGSLSEELQKRRIDLSTAMMKFTKQSSELKTAKKEWAAAQQAADATIKRASLSIKNASHPALLQAKAELEASTISEAAAKRIFDAYKKEADIYPGKHLFAESVEAEFKTAVTERSLLDQELATARLLEARDPSRFEEVDHPETQERPIGPRHGVIAIITFIGVFLVFAWFSMKDVLLPRPSGSVTEA